MCTVVGSVGFSGGEPLPAATTRLRFGGHTGREGTGEAVQQHAQDRPGSRSSEPSGADSSDSSDASGDSGGDQDRPSPESAMMDRFLSDYLALMSGRIAAIRQHIDAARYEEARVAILSLESASGMVGETVLRGLLRDLRHDVDSATPQRRTQQLVAIAAEAIQVQARLRVR